MSRQTALVIFLVALAVRLVWLALMFDGDDSLRAGMPELEAAARGFAETGSPALRDDSGDWVHWVDGPPGYVGWLAFWRLSAAPAPVWAVLAQCLLDAFVCVAVGWLGQATWSRLALPAGLVAAFNVNMVMHATQIAPPTLLLALLVFGTLFALRLAREATIPAAIGAGILAGFAWLVEPAAGWFALLPVAALAWGWYRLRPPVRGMLLPSGALVLALAVVVAPWYYRSLSLYGELALDAGAGRHAMTREAPAVLAAAENLPRTEALDGMRADLLIALDDAAAAGADLTNPFIVDGFRAEVAAGHMARAGVGDLARAWLAGLALNLSAPAMLAAGPVRSADRARWSETTGTNVAHRTWRWLGEIPGGLAFLVVGGVVLTALARLLSMGGLFRLRLGEHGVLDPLPVGALGFAGLIILLDAGPVVGVESRLAAEPLLDILLAAALLAVLRFWVGPGRRRRRRTMTPEGPPAAETMPTPEATPSTGDQLQAATAASGTLTRS